MTETRLLIILALASIVPIILILMLYRWWRGLQAQLGQKISELHQLQTQSAVDQSRLQSKQEEAEGLHSELQKWRDAARKLELEKSALEQKQILLEERALLLKSEISEMQKLNKLEMERAAQVIIDASTEKLSRSSKENFETLLRPFDERLKELNVKIHETYNVESRERISLKAELNHLMTLQKQMATETSSLTQALKGDSKVQGDWGEVILERILESSGLRQGMDYVRQGENLALRTEEGQHRKPDIVVHLPDSRNVIIDSKVSLKAFEAYQRAQAPAEREAILTNFIESVRNHVRELAMKDYPGLYGIKSPDCVLMFLPTDGSFSLAMQSDPDLAQMAWSQKVAIVCPSLLFPTLKVVEYMWRQDKQSKNSQQIAEQAGLLYDKFCLFVEDLDKMGERLAAMDHLYHETMAKLKNGRGNLLSRFEKLRSLGARAKKQLNVVDGSEDEAPAQLEGQAEL